MAKVQIKSEKLSRSGEKFLSIDILLSNNRTTKSHLWEYDVIRGCLRLIV